MQLAERVRDLAGLPVEIVTVPYEEAYGKGFEDMARRIPDLSKIRGMTGYAPEVDLDTMLRRIISFQRAELG